MSDSQENTNNPEQNSEQDSSTNTEQTENLNNNNIGNDEIDEATEASDDAVDAPEEINTEAVGESPADLYNSILNGLNNMLGIPANYTDEEASESKSGGNTAGSTGNTFNYSLPNSGGMSLQFTRLPIGSTAAHGITTMPAYNPLGPPDAQMPASAMPPMPPMPPMPQIPPMPPMPPTLPSVGGTGGSAESLSSLMTLFGLGGGTGGIGGIGGLGGLGGGGSNFDELLNRTLLEYKSRNKKTSKKVLDTLEVLDFDSNKDYFKSEVCSICQSTFADGDKILKLPCKDAENHDVPHYFHEKNDECDGVRVWLKDNNTCPICRYEFEEETEPEEIKEESKEELTSSEAGNAAVEPDAEGKAEEGIVPAGAGTDPFAGMTNTQINALVLNMLRGGLLRRQPAATQTTYCPDPNCANPRCHELRAIESEKKAYDDAIRASLGAGGDVEVEVNEEKLTQLMDMGFDKYTCTNLLKRYNNNVDIVMEQLLSNF
jgi:hypothetical protein